MLRDFRCIVHMHSKAVQTKQVPLPMLNRFEKFYLGVEDFLEHAVSRLCDRVQQVIACVQAKVRMQSIYSMLDSSVFVAIVITRNRKRKQQCFATEFIGQERDDL